MVLPRIPYFAMICSASHQKRTSPLIAIGIFFCAKLTAFTPFLSIQFKTEMVHIFVRKESLPLLNEPVTLWFAYGCLWLPTLLVASVRVARSPPRPPCSPLGARRGLTKLRGAHSRYSPSGPWMALGGAPPSATHQTSGDLHIRATFHAVGGCNFYEY